MERAGRVTLSPPGGTARLLAKATLAPARGNGRDTAITLYGSTAWLRLGLGLGVGLGIGVGVGLGLALGLGLGLWLG